MTIASAGVPNSASVASNFEPGSGTRGAARTEFIRQDAVEHPGSATVTIDAASVDSAGVDETRCHEAYPDGFLRCAVTVAPQAPRFSGKADVMLAGASTPRLASAPATDFNDLVIVGS